MRYASFLIVCGFGWAAAIACGGSDSNGTGSNASAPCTQVCNCVGAIDPGAKTTCTQQCGSISATTAPANRVSTCQGQLASNYSSCNWTCDAFAPSATGSGGSNGGSSCSPSSDVNPTLCIQQGMPKKLKCSNAAAQNNALAAGCVKENSVATDDLNVCCSSGGGPGGAPNAGGFPNQGGFVNQGGFIGTGAGIGTGGEGTGATFGAGGFVEIGPGGSFNAGGYIGTGAGFGAGGYIGSAGSTGVGGRVTCDTTWLADCTTTACSCSLDCVQTCSSCTPNCARKCSTDADCVGSGVYNGSSTFNTPHCFVNDPLFPGWCTSTGP